MESPRKELDYLRRTTEQTIARMLLLDTQSTAIRHELEQKRRGFALIAELAATLNKGTDFESMFVSVSRRINSALNMQRSVVFVPDHEGFRPVVLQGYDAQTREKISRKRLPMTAELLDPAKPLLVTGKDSPEYMAALREALALPFFIAAPVVLNNHVAALLVTGRMLEQQPWMPRLGQSDLETVKAVSACLATMMAGSRMLEAEEKSLRVKSEFLANMSHEILTPMNAVLGAIRLLSGADLNEKQRVFLEKADQSADQLMRIIRGVLDFSKIDAGQMTMESEPFSLRQTTNTVAAQLREQVEAKELSLHINLSDDVPDMLRGVPARLEQVLLTLLHNAIKFTAQGTVGLYISVMPPEPGQASNKITLLFEVRDSGIGMTREQVDGLFTPFRQADGSVTRHYGGTGLGLAIARGLVELMDGRIWCESAHGKGSRFFFTVVFSHADSRQDEVQAESAPAGIGDIGDFEELHGMRVLLAEDNEINQMVAVELLNDKGIIVDTADDGEEALEALNRGCYDLVLMDIQMPNMDGLTATINIRANPRFTDLPILALTAHAMPGDREISLKSGMNDHLTKPIDPNILYKALLRWKGKCG